MTAVWQCCDDLVGVLLPPCSRAVTAMQQRSGLRCWQTARSCAACRVELVGPAGPAVAEQAVQTQPASCRTIVQAHGPATWPAQSCPPLGLAQVLVAEAWVPVAAKARVQDALRVAAARASSMGKEGLARETAYSPRVMRGCIESVVCSGNELPTGCNVLLCLCCSGHGVPAHDHVRAAAHVPHHRQVHHRIPGHRGRVR